MEPSRDIDYEQLLEEAFGHLARPSEITPCGCDECLGITEALNNADWRTMDRQQATYTAMDAPLLSRDAFQFFLPGILRFAHADPWGDEAHWLGMLFRGGFTEDSDKEDLNYLESRVGSYSEPQRLAILRFLERMDFEGSFADDDDTIHQRVLEWWRETTTLESDAVT